MLVTVLKINYYCVVSDHHPVSGTININVITPYIDDGNNDVKQRVAWDKLPDNTLKYYEQLTETGFDGIITPDGVKCIDPKAPVTPGLRPVYDLPATEKWANRSKNVRLVAEVVRLVAAVVGDRKGQISRSKGVVMFKTQSHRAYDQVTTYLR